MFTVTKICFFFNRKTKIVLLLGLSSGPWSCSTQKPVPVDQTNLERTFHKSLSDMYSCVWFDLMTNVEFPSKNWCAVGVIKWVILKIKKKGGRCILNKTSHTLMTESHFVEPAFALEALKVQSWNLKQFHTLSYLTRMLHSGSPSMHDFFLSWLPTRLSFH